MSREENMISVRFSSSNDITDQSVHQRQSQPSRNHREPPCFWYKKDPRDKTQNHLSPLVSGSSNLYFRPYYSIQEGLQAHNFPRRPRPSGSAIVARAYRTNGTIAEKNWQGLDSICWLVLRRDAISSITIFSRYDAPLIWCFCLIFLSNLRPLDYA